MGRIHLGSFLGMQEEEAWILGRMIKLPITQQVEPSKRALPADRLKTKSVNGEDKTKSDFGLFVFSLLHWSGEDSSPPMEETNSLFVSSIVGDEQSSIGEDDRTGVFSSGGLTLSSPMEEMNRLFAAPILEKTNSSRGRR
nr:hypothetical protein Iba_chr12eCG6010 [Ipomoea batatas]